MKHIISTETEAQKGEGTGLEPHSHLGSTMGLLINLFPENHPEQTSRRPESWTGPLSSFKAFQQKCPMRQRELGFPISMVRIPSSSELRVP